MPFSRFRQSRDRCAGFGADDGAAQHGVGLGVGKDLDETIRVGVAARPGIGGERELAGFVVDARLFQLFLCFPDTGDLGPSVDDAGDGVVIDVAGLAGQDFDRDDAFVLGLVGQHGSADDVAECVDALGVGWKVLVHPGKSFPGPPDALCSEAPAPRSGTPPGRAHHHIGIEHMIPQQLMEAKIREAVAARRGDMVIIGRTNAVRASGMDDALRRAEGYREAGADRALPSPRHAS